MLANEQRGIVETCAVIIGGWNRGKPTNEVIGRLDVEELPRFYPVEKCRLARTTKPEEETSRGRGSMFARRTRDYGQIPEAGTEAVSETGCHTGTFCLPGHWQWGGFEGLVLTTRSK